MKTNALLQLLPSQDLTISQGALGAEIKEFSLGLPVYESYATSFIALSTSCPIKGISWKHGVVEYPSSVCSLYGIELLRGTHLVALSCDNYLCIKGSDLHTFALEERDILEVDGYGIFPGLEDGSVLVGGALLVKSSLVSIDPEMLKPEFDDEGVALINIHSVNSRLHTPDEDFIFEWFITVGDYLLFI